MIAVAVDAEGWPAASWDAIATRAVRAALRPTRFAALDAAAAQVEVSIQLATDAEVHVLNRQYRGHDKATNVLSFPMLEPGLLETIANSEAGACVAGDAGGEVLLGDIVLARETCAREAADRDVAIEAHAAHLIVHGTLHLLGYDHMTDHEADAMEAIERRAMLALGLHDPYPLED